MNTVLLLSGGLDSVTLLAHLSSEGCDVGCVSFDYGQTHVRELDAARFFSSRYNASHRIVTLPDVFSGSALTGDIPMPSGHYSDETMRQTVVPNRNMVMLSIATSIAIQWGASNVAYAAHADDFGVYPDCRPQFIGAMKTAMSLCDWSEINLLAPFAGWGKRDIYRHAVRLGVDVEKTWSCYSGGELPCGKCGACSARREAIK